jgi:hypothetical protein
VDVFAFFAPLGVAGFALLELIFLGGAFVANFFAWGFRIRIV